MPDSGAGRASATRRFATEESRKRLAAKSPLLEAIDTPGVKPGTANSAPPQLGRRRGAIVHRFQALIHSPGGDEKKFAWLNQRALRYVSEHCRRFGCPLSISICSTAGQRGFRCG